MTISVCMIVKNEEKVLARCLTCLAGLYDQLIIVDTGSTDQTKAIARKYTDQVYDFAWIDDFAAARNYALQFATMDYVYVADGDEVIDEENRRRFLALKESLPETVDIVQMKYANQLHNATTYNFDVEYRPKLFRRQRPFRFVEPIHETLDLTFHTINSEITITHMPEENHAGRDFGIYQRLLRRGYVLSPKLHMMYARELFIAGTDEDFLQAYAYFEATLHDECRGGDEITQAQCVVSKAARLSGDADTLLKTALKNVIGSPSAEICCQLGEYYLQKGDPEEAATWFYTAAFGAACELNVHYGGDLPLSRLADCYQRLGCQKEAAAYRKKASSWQVPKGDA